MRTSAQQPESAAGVHGILAPAARLDRWLLVVLVVLLATSAMRYVDRHGLDAAGVAVLAGALLLGVAYARVLGSPRAYGVAVASVVSAVLVLFAAAAVLAWIRTRRLD